MNELEKYTLLWDLPQGYGNNYGHPYWKEIVTYLSTGLHDRGLHPGATLLDIGGGNGSLRGSFENVGVHYTSLDIAPNSGADIIGDISDRQAADVKTFDYGISIDVMEHLPTDRVDDALANIRQTVNHSVAFLISTRPDRGGKKIGQTLHMTVKEPSWWLATLAAHWGSVDLIRVVAGEYCMVVVTP